MPPSRRPPRSRRPYRLTERERALVLQRVELDAELLARLRVVTFEADGDGDGDGDGERVVLWLRPDEAETLADRVRAAAEIEPEPVIRRELERIDEYLGGRDAAASDPAPAMPRPALVLMDDSAPASTPSTSVSTPASPAAPAKPPARARRLRRLRLVLSAEERELLAAHTAALSDLPADARRRLAAEPARPLKLWYTQARDLRERIDEAAGEATDDGDHATASRLWALYDRIATTVRERWPECGGRDGRSPRWDPVTGGAVRVHPDQRVPITFRRDELDRLHGLATLADELRHRLDAGALGAGTGKGSGSGASGGESPLLWLTVDEMGELVDAAGAEQLRLEDSDDPAERAEAWEWERIADRVLDVYGAYDDGGLAGWREDGRTE